MSRHPDAALLALKAEVDAARALAESLGDLHGAPASSTRARAIAAASSAAADVMAELRRKIAARC